jgi:hypothetical protein
MFLPRVVHQDLVFISVYLSAVVLSWILMKRSNPTRVLWRLIFWPIAIGILFNAAFEHISFMLTGTVFVKLHDLNIFSISTSYSSTFPHVLLIAYTTIALLVSYSALQFVDAEYQFYKVKQLVCGCTIYGCIAFWLWFFGVYYIVGGVFVEPDWAGPNTALHLDQLRDNVMLKTIGFFQGA